MSLSFDRLEKDDLLIATLNNGAEKEGEIYYIDDDELPEGTKPLLKIRINDRDKSFFPAITDFASTKQTDHIMVSGPTGTGKSTWIADYIKHFRRKYPKAQVLLFSSKTTDETLDKIKYIERVKIDDDMLSNPYTLEEIAALSKPLLTIFDDVEDFPNKKLNNEIARLRDEIIRNGRSYGLYCIYVSHDPCNYRSTKSQLFEANKCVIFPRRAGVGTYDYLLDKKLHIGKKNIELVKTLKSNFVVINKSVPQTIIADKYILLM
jgi:hypothetical protein